MSKKSGIEILFNLPNTLTAFRLLCIPGVIICLHFGGKLSSFLSALFFSLAFITDILDGYFARRYGLVTVFGKFLDPLADKILVSLTMIMLVRLHWIPAWMVMVIIAREMAVTGLRSVAVSEGIVIQASSLGKYKTIFQASAVIGLCLHYKYMDVDFHKIGMIFLWVALVLTIWSGWAYFSQFSQVFFSKRKEKKRPGLDG